jgi:hypothetical protein
MAVVLERLSIQRPSLLGVRETPLVVISAVYPTS